MGTLIHGGWSYSIVVGVFDYSWLAINNRIIDRIKYKKWLIFVLHLFTYIN